MTRASTKGLIALTVASWSAAAVAQSHVDIAARSGGAGSASLVGASNDGTASYSYGFQLPPSGGRFQPALGLFYNSGSHRSVNGVGWSLTENFIEARQDGTPNVSGQLQTRYYVIRNGQRQLLYALGNEWRPDVADGYFSVWQSIGSWQARDAAGNVYTYFTSSTQPRIARWYLNQVADVDGHVVQFVYSALTTDVEAGTGERILTEIRYGGAGMVSATNTALYDILLSYQTISPFYEAFAGQVNTWDRRLSTVAVRRWNQATSIYNQLYGYRLEYSQSPDTGNQLLSKLWQYGHDFNTPLGLPTQYTYSTQAGGNGLGSFGQSQSVPALTSDDSTLLSPSTLECSQWLGGSALTGYSYNGPCPIGIVAAWVDLDGDGRPDLVWGGAGSDPTRDGLRWARNLTTPHQGVLTFDKVKLISGSAGWTGKVSAVFGSGETPNTVSHETLTRLMDVNGDRRPDLVTANTTNCGPAAIEVRFAQVDGTGALSYAAPICMDASAVLADWGAQHIPLTRWTSGGTTNDTVFDLVDVTGDGIPDAVLVTGSGTWSIYPGYRNGAAWGFAGGTARLASAPGLLNSSYAIRQSDSSAGSVHIDLIDLNGDGILDRVLSDPASPSSWSVELGGGVDPSNGTIHFGSPITWAAAGGSIDAISMSNSVAEYGAGPSYAGLLVDYNRDGRPDYLLVNTFQQLLASPNIGTTFASSASSAGFPGDLFDRVRLVPAPTPCTPNCHSTLTGSNNGLVDVNGDGAVDQMTASTSSWSWAPAVSHVMPSDLLVGVQTPTNANTALTYAPSSEFAAAGTWSAGVYPVLVRSVLSGPGITALNVQYTYQNLLSIARCEDQAPCDSLTELEPLGFGTTYRQDDATGQVAETVYGSSHVLAGVPTSALAGTGTFSAFAGSYPVPALTPTSQRDTTWGTRPLAAADCSGATSYPLIRYAATAIATELESGAQKQRKMTLNCPDTFGNVPVTTVVPDQDAPTVGYRQSVTYLATNVCPACVATQTTSTLVNPPQDTGDLGFAKNDYDASAHVTAVRGPGGIAVRTMAYNGPASSLSSVVVSYPIQYRADGNGGSVAVPAYSVTRSYQYDSNTLEVSSDQMSDGATTLITSYSRDPSLGLMTSVTGPYLAGSTAGPTRTYSYDTFNRTTNVALEGSKQAAYSYVLTGDTLGSSAATYGGVTLYTFATQLPVTDTTTARDDINASTTWFDALGRPLQKAVRLGTGVVAPASGQISMPLSGYLVSDATAYDAAGRVIGRLDPYLTSTDPGAANLTWRDQLGTVAGQHVTRYGYDQRSRMVCTTYGPIVNGNVGPAPSDRPSCVTNNSSGAYQRAAARVYGLEQATPNDGRTYRFVDDVPDWENDNSPNTAVRSYFDASGRLVYSKDQYQNLQQFIVDPLGRTTAQVRYAGTNQPGTVQASEARTFDAWGRVVKDVDNCANALASSPDYRCRVRLYNYLPTGELQSATQAPNSSVPTGTLGVQNVYGSLGRLTERDLVTWSYNGSTYVQNLAIDGTFAYDTPAAPGLNSTAGRLASATNAVATIQFGYDSAGRLTDRLESILPNSEWERISRAYRNDGQLLSTTVTAAGSTLAYYTHYDSAGRPALINDSSTGTGSVEYWKVDPSSGYDSLGRLASAFTDNESLKTVGNFDSAISNMMTSYSVQLANAPATRFVDAGSPTYLGSKLHTFQDVKAQTTFTFDYDRAGRLRHANATGTASNALAQNYDRQYSVFVGATKDNIATLNSQSSSPSLGNLTYLSNESTLSGILVSDKTYVYDPINTEQIQNTYYPNPSVVQDVVGYGLGTGVVTLRSIPNCGSVVSFSYDAQDRLTQIWNGVVEETLAYDATGALARRVLQNQSRYYLGQDATLTVSGASTTAKIHILLSGTRIASVQGRTLTYYHRDHMGSVIATSTAGGVSGSAYRYDLYGKSAASSEVAGAESELGFTGGLKLSEGLVALGARVYDPALRQFLQSDNVDSNRYTYVRGDPINHIDPTGHEDKAEGAFDWVSWQNFLDYGAARLAGNSGGVSMGTTIGIGGSCGDTRTTCTPDVQGGMRDASGRPMMATISGFLNGWYGALGNRLPAWLRGLGVSMGGHWQADPNEPDASDCGGRECGPSEIAVHGGGMTWVLDGNLAVRAGASGGLRSSLCLLCELASPVRGQAWDSFVNFLAPIPINRPEEYRSQMADAAKLGVGGVGIAGMGTLLWFGFGETLSVSIFASSETMVSSGFVAVGSLATGYSLGTMLYMNFEAFHYEYWLKEP